MSDAERGGDGRRSERHRERERRRRLTATCCGGLPRPSPHRSRRCRRRRRRRLPRLRGTAACCRCRCRRCCSRRRARAARARASAGTAPWPPASPPANATQEAFRWGSVGFLQTGFQRGSLEFNRWRTKKKNGAEDSWWEVPVATPRAGCVHPGSAPGGGGGYVPTFPFDHLLCALLASLPCAPSAPRRRPPRPPRRRASCGAAWH